MHGQQVRRRLFGRICRRFLPDLPAAFRSDLPASVGSIPAFVSARYLCAARYARCRLGPGSILDDTLCAGLVPLNKLDAGLLQLNKLGACLLPLNMLGAGLVPLVTLGAGLVPLNKLGVCWCCS